MARKNHLQNAKERWNMNHNFLKQWRASGISAGWIGISWNIIQNGRLIFHVHQLSVHLIPVIWTMLWLDWLILPGMITPDGATRKWCPRKRLIGIRWRKKEKRNWKRCWSSLVNLSLWRKHLWQMKIELLLSYLLWWRTSKIYMGRSRVWGRGLDHSPLENHKLLYVP